MGNKLANSLSSFYVHNKYKVPQWPNIYSHSSYNLSHTTIKKNKRNSIRKSLSKSSKTSSKIDETFFIEYHQQSQSRFNNLENVDLKKRVIFISLMGLYHSWRDCPSTVLLSSIFILPLRKQSIYQTNKKINNNDVEDEFIKMIQGRCKLYWFSILYLYTYIALF